LNQIVSLFPTSNLKPRAEKLIEVLGKRKEIEDYLTNLQVTRVKDDTTIIVQPERVRMIRNDSTIIRPPQKNIDSARQLSQVLPGNIPLAKDSLIATTRKVSGPYAFNYANPHMVVMMLDKVDRVYVRESKNALDRYVNEYFYSMNITVSPDTLDASRNLVIFNPFPDAQEALAFLLKLKKAVPNELSWLPPSKYSFFLIDNDNLVRMKATKDLDGYKALLKKMFPQNF
jgi:hypothetical protein